MSKLSVEEISRRFESSKEFNEIFDAFEEALDQRLDTMEIYLRLFWNQTLSPDEVCLFGEKLAKEFPTLAYDVYMWLATVFEATYAMFDNHQLSFEYFQKASVVRPDALDAYLDAAACYERDLNIPPLTTLIEFLKKGTDSVSPPTPLYERLITLYEIDGNDEMIEYYKRKLRDCMPPPQDNPPSE